jgi:hypothetical protein
MRIPYPPIFVGTVVAVALATGVAGTAQAKSDIPAHKADAEVVDGGALALRRPIKPVDVVTPIVVDKGGWTNDPYLT